MMIGAHVIHLTSDGGYAVAGYSKSADGDVEENAGIRDYWMLKLDAAGNITWEESFGGSSKDNAHSMQLTMMVDSFLAGVTESFDGDVTANQGGKDCWIVKLDGTGIIQWQKSFGGSEDDDANCIQQTSDGGYIFAGFSYSSNGNLSGNLGGMDCWVVKLDATGNITWEKNLGGTLDDDGYWVEK
jgi:hypothetical protein